jgi:clan AA aspartic protease
MIEGSVNADLEAIVRLVVLGPGGGQQTLEAVIDTGFSGHLTLPESVIASLDLTWLGREPGILADGSTDLFDVYSAEILWDGRRRTVEIQAANTQPLAGMELLHRYSLHIDVVAGGRVAIDAVG